MKCNTNAPKNDVLRFSKGNLYLRASSQKAQLDVGNTHATASKHGEHHYTCPQQKLPKPKCSSLDWMDLFSALFSTLIAAQVGMPGRSGCLYTRVLSFASTAEKAPTNENEEWSVINQKNCNSQATKQT